MVVLILFFDVCVRCCLLLFDVLWADDDDD